MRQLDMYFRALADTNRLRILNLLFHGELCVCDIQRVLSSSQPNISRHLAYLRNAGLILDRRDSLRMFYRLNDDGGNVRTGLYKFLRFAFRHEQALQDDLRNLKQAIHAGQCALPGRREHPAPPRVASAGSVTIATRLQTRRGKS